MTERRFENQSAIVTGGADGIGKAIARRLATEGASVTLFDLSEENTAATLREFAGEGLSVHGEKVDISDETSVIAGLAATVARHPGRRLDIMINCAAIVGPTNRRITEVTTEEFDLEHAINLRGDLFS